VVASAGVAACIAAPDGAGPGDDTAVSRAAVTTAANYLALATKTPPQLLNTNTTPSTNTLAQAAADAYYATWNAPATNQDFLQQFGFMDGDAAGVAFYNAHDLGIGRIVRCTDRTGKIACASENFGSFGGPEAQALDDTAHRRDNFATVSMVFDPATLRVDFVVYEADGKRTNFAQLDTVGLNSAIPFNCTNCHGGLWSDTTKAWTANSHFLAYDLDTFTFARFPGYGGEEQQGEFRRINALVRETAVKQNNTPMVTTIDGWYGGVAAVNGPNARYSAGFVPPGWAAGAQTNLYTKVIVPYCRTCHLANPPDLNVQSVSIPATLGNPTQLTGALCQGHRMPVAEKPAKLFWADDDAQLAVVDATGQVCNTAPGFVSEMHEPFPPSTPSTGGQCQAFDRSFTPCYPGSGPQGWEQWAEGFCAARGDHLGTHDWRDACPGGFHAGHFECCP
jgi:hypothetical protein